MNVGFPIVRLNLGDGRRNGARGRYNGIMEMGIPKNET